METNNDLQLIDEAPPPSVTARRDSLRRYGRSLSEYAADFGLGKHGDRTLKRYAAHGRAVTPADLPPFDAPRELAAWWRRMREAGILKHQVPEWMTMLEIGAVPGRKNSPEMPQVGQKEREAVPSESKKPDAGPVELPPEFALPQMDDQASDGERHLREFAASWLEEMGRAQKAKDKPRFFKAWTEYKALIKELRAWQKDRQRERLSTGEVLEADKEMAVLSSVFGTMAKTFTGSLMLLVKRLQPDLDDLRVREIALPYRDKIFTGLKGTRFARALPPDVLAAFADEAAQLLAA